MWRGLWSALFVIAFILAGFPAYRAFAGTPQRAFTAAEAACECKTAEPQCGQAKTECTVEQCLAFCGVQNQLVSSGRAAIFRADIVAKVEAAALTPQMRLRNEHPPFRPPRF